jgi:hypothetical protein
MGDPAVDWIAAIIIGGIAGWLAWALARFAPSLASGPGSHQRLPGRESGSPGPRRGAFVTVETSLAFAHSRRDVDPSSIDHPELAGRRVDRRHDWPGEVREGAQCLTWGEVRQRVPVGVVHPGHDPAQAVHHVGELVQNPVVHEAEHLIRQLARKLGHEDKAEISRLYESFRSE